MILYFVTCPEGDWKAVYFDDELCLEGHSIAASTLAMELIGKRVTGVGHYSERDDVESDPHLSRWGNRFPQTRKELAEAYVLDQLDLYLAETVGDLAR